MIPNTVVLSSAIVPLREPDAVDLLARLRPGVKPSEVQRLLDERVTVPTRAKPHIELEEVDADEVVVRVTATPATPSDGPRLADEILATMADVTRDGTGEPRGAGDARDVVGGGPDDRAASSTRRRRRAGRTSSGRGAGSTARYRFDRCASASWAWILSSRSGG
jgi:hypothetical protein